ncbi:MAG: diguanylate cyclase, partial [Cohnella sp.]|nr:diguanylate cyclase [Cohnella sp.]
MTERYRINLLIPYLDGEYYGTIFTTLHREIHKRNSTLFTIHALASVENPAAFDYQIGTEDTDGWLLLMNPYSVLPSSPKFLAAIEASGKPIVTIGYQENSIRCHSVVIDNRQAIKDAVRHLVRDHGHRRIAFVGSAEHVDLIERFEGYREALRDNGIDYDDKLYYRANNSLRHGGASAAQAMLESGMDFTAVIAATDLNAMGMIETLQASGYRIPEEMAVIGFDDLPSAETFTPPLTSVHQSIADLARASVDLLYRKLAGEDLPRNVTYIPTAFVQRSSCGCLYQSKDMPVEALHRKLERSEANIDQLISSHNQLAANWASASREEFFDFSRMFREISHWGCLAMWETDKNDHRHLIIKQAFSKYNEPVPPIGLRIPIEQFPPVNWLPKLGDNDYVRVQSIRSDREDLGFIVLVGPIDKLVLVSEVDITRISCNISVTALVRDQLYHQVRSIAEQLEIVSRTTNDGIWDWDLVAGHMQWSTRTHDMFSSIGETLTSDPDSFFRLVHPEDYPHVTSAFQKHIDDGTPLKIEFRIIGSDGGRQLWLYAAGDSIRDHHGNKIRTIGSLTNITEKKLAENQITRLAYHDALTGLPNRQLFRERFEQSQRDADHNRCKMGIMLIDLDRFKIINDTLGHQIGDQLLQEVARMMEDIVYTHHPAHGADREGGSTVARLGGDEFIVLLKDVQDVSPVKLIADRLIQGFQNPFVIENLELFTTASIGMSIYPDDGADLDTLYRCADIAMYKAKENGKNRSELYNGAINSLTFERLSMETELRRALERSEFELHYQPQIALDKNEIYGVEALIRW